MKPPKPLTNHGRPSKTPFFRLSLLFLRPHFHLHHKHELGAVAIDTVLNSCPSFYAKIKCIKGGIRSLRGVSGGLMGVTRGLRRFHGVVSGGLRWGVSGALRGVKSVLEDFRDI